MEQRIFQKGVYCFGPFENRIYVGATGTSFAERYLQHLFKLKKQSHNNIFLQHYFDQIGILEMQILEVVDDIYGLKKLEDNWMRDFRRKKIKVVSKKTGNPGRRTLPNMAPLWILQNKATGRKAIIEDPVADLDKLKSGQYYNNWLQTDFTKDGENGFELVKAGYPKCDILQLKQSLTVDDYNKPYELHIQ